MFCRKFVIIHAFLVLIFWAKNAVSATCFAFCNYVYRILATCEKQNRGHAEWDSGWCVHLGAECWGRVEKQLWGKLPPLSPAPAYTHTPSCDSRKGKENRTLQWNWSESVRLFWESEFSCPCSFWRPAVRGCRVEDAGGAVQGGRPARPGHRAGRLLWLAARSSSPCRTSSPHCPLVAATHPVQQVSMVIIWLFFSFLACFYLGILESPTLPCVRDLWL